MSEKKAKIKKTKTTLPCAKLNCVVINAFQLVFFFILLRVRKTNCRSLFKINGSWNVSSCGWHLLCKYLSTNTKHLIYYLYNKTVATVHNRRTQWYAEINLPSTKVYLHLKVQVPTST